jgi:hypothetical protein
MPPKCARARLSDLETYEALEVGHYALPDPEEPKIYLVTSTAGR